MVVETKVKSGGVWRTITAPEVKSGGVWRAVQQIQVKSGGVWRTVFETSNPLNVTNIVISHTVSSGGVAAGAEFNANGTIEQVGPLIGGLTLLGLDSNGNDHTGEWYDGSPTGSQWEIRCVSMISGAWLNPPAAVGVWIDLSADRRWKINRPGGKGYTPGTTAAKGNFTIREKADTANLVNFTLDATATQT